MLRYLLDTNIVIYTMKRRPIEHTGAKCTTSTGE